jgi:aqualysin 1
MSNRRFPILHFARIVTALVVMMMVMSPAAGPWGGTMTTVNAQAPQAGAAQDNEKFRRSPRSVPGQYIVVLEDWAAGPKGPGSAADAVAANLANAHGGAVGRIYRNALLGFSVRMPEAAARRMSLDERVAFVEEDGTVEAFATQLNPPWGLDRIDQRILPLNQTYNYDATGVGVKVYVIDTGIRFSHVQFGGRAISGFDSVDGGSADDCNGHGTHVAGTIGSAAYGVAKGVSLVGVRVLNCQGSGSTAGVIAGIDWVSGNHQAGQPAVANMSLGGGASSALDTAVLNSINDGVTYAIAAGNSNANACNASPARVGPAITVGATGSNDARASYSNFGTCLDLFAPGSSILSSWHTSDMASNTISGTSMAAPHAAGVAALYLEDHPSATPQAVRDAIVNTATPGVVTGAGSGSPNLLLYSLFDVPEPPDPPDPPASCTAESYTGTLSGTGDFDVQPNGTYFFTTAGLHNGVLDGPVGTDFDLYLYRWSGFGWSNVARSISTTSHESVIYQGSAGYYQWRVLSYSGAGTYSFCMSRP